jgi:hypothetical protein
METVHPTVGRQRIGSDWRFRTTRCANGLGVDTFQLRAPENLCENEIVLMEPLSRSEANNAIATHTHFGHRQTRYCAKWQYGGKTRSGRREKTEDRQGGRIEHDASNLPFFQS